LNYVDPDIPTIPGLEQSEVELLTISVGTHRPRRPLQPIEVAELLDKALQAGATADFLSDSIGLSKSMMGSFRRLSKLTNRIRSMVSWHRSRSQLTLETANFIARLSEDHQDPIVDLILSREVTGAELRSSFQRSKSGQMPLVDAISEIVGRRPEVITRHVFIGSLIDVQLIEAMSMRTQNERDLALKRVCLKLFTEEFMSGVLGATQFTIVLSELSEAISPENSESTVRQMNDLLLKEVDELDS
jgi:hypothetical protein